MSCHGGDERGVVKDAQLFTEQFLLPVEERILSVG